MSRYMVDSDISIKFVVNSLDCFCEIVFYGQWTGDGQLTTDDAAMAPMTQSSRVKSSYQFHLHGVQPNKNIPVAEYLQHRG